MIKKLILASLMMLVLLIVSSCKDDENTSVNNVEKPQNVEMADYTIIFWGMAGKLDQDLIQDLHSLLSYRENGKIGSNINFVGMLKSSVSASFSSYDGFDKTMYFDLGKKTGKTIQSAGEIFGGAIYGKQLADAICNAYNIFYQNANGKEVGGTDYALNNIDSLASFIKTTAQTHPAKHYVLMLFGHGNGFHLVNDTRTRGCVYDDYLSKSMPVQDIAKAVKQSGIHIQTIFAQNCLMSTLENIPYYHQAADYAFLSSEQTMAHYMHEYVANLSKAGDDLEKMKEASRNTVDYYVDTYSKSSISTSHGFYDLSKTDQLLSVCKKIAAWYSNVAEEEPVFINKVIANSLCACELLHIRDIAPDQEYNLIDLRQKLIEMYKPNEFSQWTKEDAAKFVESADQVMKYSVTGGLIFSHIMYQSLRLKNEAKVAHDFSVLQSLFDEYLSVLKSMAYIRATSEDKSIPDYAYIFTSPSVQVIPFNSAYKLHGMNQTGASSEVLAAVVDEFYEAFHGGDVAKVNELFTKYFVGYSYKVPMETLLEGYTNTLFDQQTQWSDFLKKQQCIPTVLTNPERADYINGVRAYKVKSK